MEPGHAEQAKRQVTSLIHSYFEIGNSKELATIPRLFAPPRYFTKFDDSPPYTRQNANDAFVHEQAKFANISDYHYKVEDLRIDVLGSAAVATFYLEVTGVFVNDYSFEGRTVGSRSRVTLVCGLFDGDWKIVHQHASTFPEIAKEARKEWA